MLKGELKTHCKRGHEKTEENTYLNPSGARQCILCKAATNKGNSSKANKERKRLVLTHYGPNGHLGCCWTECQVVDIDMLSLDHINGGGTEHRKKAVGGVYRDVVRRDFPTGFQTLCYNHQMKKEIQRRNQN